MNNPISWSLIALNPSERLARRCKHIYRNFIASERSGLSGLCIFCKLPNAASKKCLPRNELSLSISYLYVYHGWSFSDTAQTSAEITERGAFVGEISTPVRAAACVKFLRVCK